MKQIKAYYKACQDIADKFNKVYFDGEADMYAIGGELDGVWGVNDYFFDIQNMCQALELDFKWGDLMYWYDQWTDTDEKRLRLNMKTYKDLIDDNFSLSLCPSCNCMTKTIKNKCGKCKHEK